MKATELRIGNLIEYKIEDELDERKEWWELNTVDAFDLQDLTWLDSNPEDAYFRPIKITEEWLLKFGFISNPYQDRYELNNIYFQGCKLCFECDKTKGFTELWISEFPNIQYVHQLQNLFHIVTGSELQLVENGI